MVSLAGVGPGLLRGRVVSGDWCPLQARIVLLYRGWRPYVEPLRALPLPEALYSPLRNNWQRMYCQPTRSRITDRDEVCICRALDSAEEMGVLDRATQEALGRLEQAEQELCNTLAAYASSDCQFDFAAAAHAWTTARRGRMPSGVGGCRAAQIYAAWRVAKAKKKARLVEQWSGVQKKLSIFLGAPVGDFKKGLDGQG